MRRLRLDRDIKPLSEFRAHVLTLLQQGQDTKRPLVLTRRGHSAAVLIDVTEFERLVEELDLLRDIRKAERQLADGEGIPHEEARARVMATLDR